MYYDILETELIGPLTLLADETGLRAIRFANGSTKASLGAQPQPGSALLKEAKAQLSAYFNKRLSRFDIPLTPVGTPFQTAVWEVLRTIAYGEVVSYQWVAERIGNIKAVRAVGNANGKNPLPIVVPCHRVIGRNGTLTGYAGGLDIKEKLIGLETHGDR